MGALIVKEKWDSMWYVDLRVTQYMYKELERFIKYVKSEDKQVIYLRNNFISYIIKTYDKVKVKFINGDEKIILDVLYVPRYAKN